MKKWQLNQLIKIRKYNLWYSMFAVKISIRLDKTGSVRSKKYLWWSNLKLNSSTMLLGFEKSFTKFQQDWIRIVGYLFTLTAVTTRVKSKFFHKQPFSAGGFNFVIFRVDLRNKFFLNYINDPLGITRILFLAAYFEYFIF